jgi:hypothetical protein
MIIMKYLYDYYENIITSFINFIDTIDYDDIR